LYELVLGRSLGPPPTRTMTTATTVIVLLPATAVRYNNADVP
jgi:hypothetical protein